MIPSQAWFPTNIPERAAFFNNFKTNFKTVSASLGLNAYDKQVEDDSAVFEFLADIFNQVKAFEDAVRQYRKIITEGNVGDTKPQFPPMLAFSLPIEVETGIFERLEKLRGKIMAADNYTDEIGALLQILPKSTQSIVTEEVKPVIQTFSSETGYQFSVVVEGRKEADMWDVLILRKGSNDWQTVKTAVGKSVDVPIIPTVAGESERIQVRVRLRKNNQNYGQLSDIVYVTINP